MNEQLFILSNQKKRTNHILHLLLCIPTFGLWIIAWALISAMNSSHNKAIDHKMNRILEHKLEGRTDLEAYQAIREDDQRSRMAIVIMVCAAIIIVWLGMRG